MLPPALIPSNPRGHNADDRWMYAISYDPYSIHFQAELYAGQLLSSRGLMPYTTEAGWCLLG